MKILMVSELFDPQKNIGAVRVYNFATELAVMGHTVFCVVSENDRIRHLAENDNLHIVYVQDGKIRGKRKNYIEKSVKLKSVNAEQNQDNNSKALASKKSKPSKIMAWMRKTIAQIWFLASEEEWYTRAVEICEELIKREQVSLVLTSYGPVANLLVGLKLKRKYPDIKWVSDMRDPVDSMHQQAAWRLRGWYLQKKMITLSDQVITVCDGITDRFRTFLPKEEKDKVTTIPNGYVQEPILNRPKEDGILKIGYTGQLYTGAKNMRDMSDLFRCIHAMEKETGVELPVQVHYAGGDFERLLVQAQRYKAGKYLVNHGRISKYDALRLQEKCDILCVLTWNTKKEQGVLTGKFPEYLRIRKPILALITGDLENAELSRKITELGIGFSYEYIRSKNDFIILKKWLKECMEKKKSGTAILESVDDKKIENYSYEVLSKKLENILCQLVAY